MEVKWIKLWVDMFDNIKIRKLKKLPNAMGDTIEAIWFEILALAGKVNDNGYLFYIQRGQMIPYDTKRLAEDLDRNENQIEIALNYFLDNNMVGMMDNAYMIANWTTYQDNEALQRLKQKEIHTQYMRDKRAEEKQLISSENNEQSNIEMPLNAQNKPIDEVYNKYGEYGWVKLKTSQYEKLKADFPNINIDEQIKKVDEYVQTNGNKNHYKDYNLVIRKSIKDKWFDNKTPQYRGNKTIKPTTDWCNDYIKEINEKKQEVKTDERNIEEMLKDFEERK